MEIVFEILVWLLQLICEIFLQVGMEWLAELGLQAVRAPFKPAREIKPVFAVAGYAIFGAAAGALSLVFFPSTFVNSYALRIVNLALTPVASGAFMSMLGAWRRKRGEPVIRLDRFAYATVFAFAMALVRFFFATQRY